MEQRTLKNVNNCLNTKIYSYLDTSGGRSSNLYVMFFIFSTPVLIRHQWHLKTVVFLYWCLVHTVPFGQLDILSTNVKSNKGKGQCWVKRG
jgi:hypothetical protein